MAARFCGERETEEAERKRAVNVGRNCTRGTNPVQGWRLESFCKKNGGRSVGRRTLPVLKR